MITTQINDKPDTNWDNRLKKSRLGTIYQSTELSNYQKASMGIEHEFLKFFDDSGKICAQILLSKNHLGGRIGKISKLTKIPFMKNFIYRWAYGPVIFDDTKSDEIIQHFQQYLLSKKLKANGLFHPFTKINKKIILKQFLLDEWSTFLINLSDDLDDLWKKMEKKSARKNIERSKNRGVVVKEAGYEDLSDWFELVKNVRSRIDSSLTFADIESTWNTLRKLGFAVFLAYKNDIPIGGLGFSFFNSYVTEWGVGRSSLDYDEKLYSQDLIKWEIIRWSKKNNCKYLDLTGASPNPQNEKESGILRYKKKWGGKQIPLYILKT